MEVKSLGLAAIHKGVGQITEVAEKIASSDLETVAEDAVTISLAKLQVKAGIKIIQVASELEEQSYSKKDQN